MPIHCHQRQALTEAIGRRQGWVIADEFPDEGISGAKGRDKRPGFDRLLKEFVRGKIDVVAEWSVDRLGRSLQDLVGFLSELDPLGATSISNSKRSTQPPPPDGRSSRCLAYLQSSSAQSFRNGYTPGLPEREKGTKSGKPIGRAKVDATKEAAIRTALANGKGVLKTARECRTGSSVVQRIKTEMARDNNAVA